jgi:hypothetical protein
MGTVDNILPVKNRKNGVARKAKPPPRRIAAAEPNPTQIYFRRRSCQSKPSLTRLVFMGLFCLADRPVLHG